MNKIGIVFGVAAVVTLAGCKDPDYKYGTSSSQNDVKTVEPVQIEPLPEKTCNCPPGTKHTSPCMCGAPNCKCIVEKPKAIVVDTSKPATPKAPAAAAKPVAAEPETTTYIVQRGDSLSKISKKFNIRVDAIRKANPKIKNDIVWIGQKLKLPGKVEVGEQTVPAGAIAKAPKKAYAPYTGATKEYVVKNGDTLGAIAYSNGITIRALKEMNGLSSNVIKVGQKLKIPAEKVVATAAPATAASQPAKKAVKPEAPAATAPAPVAPAAESAANEPKPAAAEAAPAPAPAAAVAENAPSEAAPATVSYVVKEGEDMTAVSILFGVSAAQIRELNNLPDDAQLVPGQVLKMPADAQQ